MDRDGIVRPRRKEEKAELTADCHPADWALRPAPPEARPPRPLAPSSIAVDDERAPPPSEAMRAAALRGTWIHQLLERLPAVEPDGIALPPPTGGSNVRPGSRTLLSAMRSSKRCAACCRMRALRRLFGPGSLAEAPLAATLPDGRVIAGTVDRLLHRREQRLGDRFQDGAGARQTMATSRARIGRRWPPMSKHLG